LDEKEAKHASLAQRMVLAQQFFAQFAEVVKSTTKPNTYC